MIPALSETHMWESPSNVLQTLNLFDLAVPFFRVNPVHKDLLDAEAPGELLLVEHFLLQITLNWSVKLNAFLEKVCIFVFDDIDRVLLVSLVQVVLSVSLEPL